MNATYLFSVGPALRPGRVRHLVAAPRRWAAWASGRPRPHGIIPQVIALLMFPTSHPVAPRPPVQMVRAQITISVSRVTRSPSLHFFTAWWRAADCEAELAYGGSLHLSLISRAI